MSSDDDDIPLSKMTKAPSSKLLKVDNSKGERRNGEKIRRERDDYDDEDIPKARSSKKVHKEGNGQVGKKRKIRYDSEKEENEDDEVHLRKRDRDEYDDDDEDEDNDEYADSNSGRKKKNKKKKKEGTSEGRSSDALKIVNKANNSKDSRKEEKKIPINSDKQLKKLDKTERIAHAMQSFLWWDAQEPPEGCQWSSMEHAGVSFPEPYVPHGIKMKYDGKDVDLNPVEEEAATFFAAMDPEGMHLGNPKTAAIFQKNFFEDFKAILNKKHGVKDFKKCDFSAIREHLHEQKIVKKVITDDQRKQNKDQRTQTMFRYGYALVDGHIEKVGNFNMEPPGAFRGRGEHPKMGKLKQRVIPEQVSINVSESAAVPIANVKGHAWGELCHNPQVQWLATWHENINNQVKYMMLAAQSSFKGKSDRSKYNKAALLCDNIENIRADYKKNLTSKQIDQRQLATAMWVIDRLALRVGGEKDTEEEADTVGCCSLRVEHLHFDPNREGEGNMEIELEFLGKDSMLFKQTINFGASMYTENDGMGAQVFKNFQAFCRGKNKTDEVFETLTPPILNAHLKGIMEGLTAKVFRTYNASKTLQDELAKQELLKGWISLTAAEKVVEYNNANRQVAILCNHQRSVSKALENQLENLGEKLAELKKQKSVLKKMLKALNDASKSEFPLKKDESILTEKVTDALAKAKEIKDSAKTNEDKIAATAADEAYRALKKELTEFKFKQAHLWDKVPSSDQVVKRIEIWNGKIDKLEMDLKHKDDNKEVALGTSKINYMDPRITVAWCKRNEIPIDKVFSKTLRDKFNWAMAVPPSWTFDASIGLQP